MRVAEFYAFMRKREAIRLAKLTGAAPPWTDDPILQKYKFTNIKRAHDRTSAALIKEFYEPHRAAPRRDILFNAGVARYFGTVEFMRAVGWTDAPTAASLKRIRNIARDRLAKRERVFTGAYIITNNGMPGPKQDVVCNIFLTALLGHLDKIILAAQERWSWQDCIEELQKCRGFGGTGFMAKETILDTRYTDFWPKKTPLDVNLWTPVGPGSMRGAARVLGDGRARLNQQETLDMCRALFELRDFWPPDYMALELHDIQFQLCEFDKYERVRFGEGRPRSLYHPRGTE